ncbi:MAG: DUF2911 domain-containing protein [Chitinophagaceae bacterium]|jgi:hypothetical protein|nr:DUF2911 domain-containing protein [Chitinophagaceae bacterium]MBK7680031.1 DUF2911 domain-containing protein [Chitinophagaceae bacterium]MBK9465713.1 DUF2911 domain-containing protein [Chitinophagaceae bacterium]MBK9660663.1 DUF2911 domain-containing protein [Chitinophagaceae bacterium]MBL0068778.1 DUF2911 domain-containing protein [Chitinophagaceae bacterium]
MKSTAFLLLCSFFLFSCSEKKKSSNDTNKGSKADTTIVSKPEKPVNGYAPVDVSPMDMSYFPVNYPILKMSDSITTPPLARVVYSRPHLQGRNLFQEVLKYGEPWRLGANEATELDLYKEATIQGKKIKAGRYILYCIPQQDQWTIVLNSNIDSWGLHPDVSKDVARFTVPVSQTDNSFEFFTMIFQSTTTGADLLMAWGYVETKLPISF